MAHEHLAPGYLPRAGAASVLHEAVRENLETFLAESRARTEHGFGVPRFVDDEMRAFLRCGVLAHGFARVVCGDCGHELLVAFSCKRRAVCPSCTGRRAADCAAHLVDEVFPQVPVRQWVLTFPRQLRFVLARDSTLLTMVIAIWLRALDTFCRRRARADGFPATRGGAVTFVQRFGSSLALNVHLHTVVPDGVFALPAPDEERASFIALSPPSTHDVEQLLARVVKRITRCVVKRFAGRDDGLAVDALDYLAAKSVRPEARRDVDDERPRGRFEAFLEGYSLHCGVRLHGNDRAGIERLCRYGARGPLTLGRLTKDAAGCFRYRMKRVIGGRHELVMTGIELVEKLAVLVPPPRVNLVRFHGVFAPNAKLRPLVVPPGPEKAAASASADEKKRAAPLSRDGTSRIDWASLLKRVFAIDVLACTKCSGRMRVIAFIEEEAVARKILEHLSLPAEPERIASARAPPKQLDFDLAA